MTAALLMPWRRPAASISSPFPTKPAGGWPKTDRCSKAGAEKTAREIVEFWRARGHWNVTAEHFVAVAARAACRGDGAVWGVKTNLVGGLPPR